jgi:hypothetical protein
MTEAKLTYAVVNCHGNSENRPNLPFSYFQVTLGTVGMSAVANPEFVRKVANPATN